MLPGRTVHLGLVSSQLYRAFVQLTETVLAPLGLFYLLTSLTGMTAGLVAALGWGCAALVWRVVARQRIPTLLWVSLGLLVARTAVGYATGSEFLYFLEPTMQNFIFALVLLATVPLRRPLIARLADDFCALPLALTTHARVQRYFRRVSLLWAVVFIANGAATLWALAAFTLGNFVLVTTLGSAALVGVGAVVSLFWFRRELRGAGFRLRFGAAPA